MIRILPKEVVNKIAAGEVVERPASVVKELVENSIDAGATEIRIIIEDFGTKKIQIIDNGSGIVKSDLENLFHKHATSKIEDINDLEKIVSYGFRGEALATISSVSEVTLETKHESDEFGTYAEFLENTFQNLKPSAITKGTSLSINNLFANIPARKKFLKSKSTENRVILDIIYKYVLVNPEISFSITIDGTNKNFPKENQKNRVAKVLGIEEKDLIEVFNDSKIKIHGFAIHPRVFLKNRNSQFTFVNKRPVLDTTIAKAVIDGYDTFLMKHQFAGFVLFIDVPASEVDVNVHPRKTEVRFAEPGEIYKAVRFSVNNALVKNLRKETLEKITVNENRLQETTSIEIHEENPTYKPEIESVEKVDANDFEEFLKSPNQTTTNYKNANPSKFLTKQAIVFNKEVSLIEGEKEFENTLNIDIENATQLLNAYIVTANKEGILIIDQHAASERYFYEKYLYQIKNKKIESKVLLTPEIVNFDDFEVPEIEKNIEVFNRLGFELESFGKNQIRIPSVPSFVKMDNFMKVFHKISEEILNSAEINNAGDKLFHEIAATLACHTAVRFGDKITKQEIIQILRNLMNCEDPYNCPHGRPIIQDFTRYDIEKKFKRCGI